jgi:hypothetical protein
MIFVEANSPRWTFPGATKLFGRMIFYFTAAQTR